MPARSTPPRLTSFATVARVRALVPVLCAAAVFGVLGCAAAPEASNAGAGAGVATGGSGGSGGAAPTGGVGGGGPVTTTTTSSSSTTTPTTSTASGPGLPGITSGGSDPGDGCSEEARKVYVVSREGHLYRFDPAALSFTDVGAVNCPVDVGISPRSMAVDREGKAWTTYSNGALFKVDIKTAACEATNFQRPEIGFRRYGMGFASNAAGSTEETLYIGDDTSLGVIDRQALVVNSLGDFQDSMVGTPELTGTGDGQLYGLFFGYPMTVRSISPSTLALGPEVEVGPAEQIQAYAFAFWGGSFWVFVAAPGGSTSVTKLDRATGASTKVLQDVGFSVVGAGVSTCAPTTNVIQ